MTWHYLIEKGIEIFIFSYHQQLKIDWDQLCLQKQSLQFNKFEIFFNRRFSLERTVIGVVNMRVELLTNTEKRENNHISLIWFFNVDNDMLSRCYFNFLDEYVSSSFFVFLSNTSYIKFIYDELNICDPSKLKKSRVTFFIFKCDVINI